MKHDFFFVILVVASAGCQYVPVQEHQSENYQASQEFQQRPEKQAEREPALPHENPKESEKSRAEYLPVKIERSQNPQNNKEKRNVIKDNTELNFVVLKDTPYYKDGPQQAGPPDGSFDQGTKLKLIKNSGSYALVETAEGVQVYVAAEDIKINQ